jgi:hypothetical protein
MDCFILPIRQKRIIFPLALAVLLLASCARDNEHRVLISVPEQRMLVLEKGVPIASFPVSTSKFGVGDGSGSCDTPLGHLEIAKKIGGNAASGQVFKNRKPTGEVVAPNSPGRDPIVTRILWLKGLEGQNRRAYSRFIYIHGTPEECNIGKPVSFGCIRMKSEDVMRLYETVGVGAKVDILSTPLPPMSGM